MQRRMNGPTIYNRNQYTSTGRMRNNVGTYAVVVNQRPCQGAVKQGQRVVKAEERVGAKPLNRMSHATNREPNGLSVCCAALAVTAGVVAAGVSVVVLKSTTRVVVTHSSITHRAGSNNGNAIVKKPPQLQVLRNSEVTSLHNVSWLNGRMVGVGWWGGGGGGGGAVVRPPGNRQRVQRAGAKVCVRCVTRQRERNVVRRVHHVSARPNSVVR